MLCKVQVKSRVTLLSVEKMASMMQSSRGKGSVSEAEVSNFHTSCKDLVDN